MEKPLKARATRIFKYGALAATLVAALALGTLSSSSGSPEKAEAGAGGNQIEAVALSEGLCTALGSAFGGIDATVAAFACQGAQNQDFLQQYVACLNSYRIGGELVCPAKPADLSLPIFLRPAPDTFDALDLDANQIIPGASYLIIAYVADDAPVRFTTEKGVFTVPSQPSVTDYRCAADSPQTQGLNLDPDCDGDSSTVGDGVVVARLLTSPADGDEGTFTVQAIQEGIAFPIEMTLVGAPERIEVTPLFGKNTIQTYPNEAICTELDVDDCPPETRASCNFAATADAVLGAVSTAEKTILVAKAFDDNDQELTGVLLDWSLAAGFPNSPPFVPEADAATWSINKNRFGTGGVSLPQTPTLDTGPLGLAFPQFVCGGTDTGTIDMVVSFSSVLTPSADPDEHVEVSVNVISGPTNIALTAEPAELDCNGVNTSKVSATVTNADGENVADGVDVNFEVYALGTTNPRLANTTAGVASTTVTALAGANDLTADGQPRGVIVNVQLIGDDNNILPAQILVRCTGGPPPPGTGNPPPPGGGAGSGGGPPTGTIRPPDTGSGGQAAGAPLLGIAGMVLAGVAALVGTRFVAARR